MSKTLEVRCSICGKHIGYASLIGDTEYVKSDYFKTLRNSTLDVRMLCDKCRDGMIDMDEVAT